MFKDEIFKEGNVVHCPEKWMAKKLLKYAHEEGYKCFDGKSYLEDDSWVHTKENTCYDIYVGLCNPKQYYKDVGKTILKFEDVYLGKTILKFEDVYLGKTIQPHKKKTIKFIKRDKDSKIPEFKHCGDAGMDISSIEDGTIQPGKHKLFKSGISADIPEDMELQVRSRSGLAYKEGIFVLNSPGTIDSNYKGDIGIILANFGDTPYKVSKGDRIAQIVPKMCPVVDVIIDTETSDSVRGEKGFGSSGIK